MLLSTAPELRPPPPTLSGAASSFSKPQKALSFPMPTCLLSPFTANSSFTVSLLHHHRYYLRRRRCLFSEPFSTAKTPQLRSLLFPPLFASASSSTFVEDLAGEPSPSDAEENWEFTAKSEAEGSDLDTGFESKELKRLDTPEVEVMQLEEIPEEWRRARLAWLCKQLPSHKSGTFSRILNSHRKWMRQEDATYVAVHCMRVRENDAGFRVYKWMMQQHWYRFDFALATKLADSMGKERKASKCREIFDDILNQGRVPSESTFHILIVAYLSAPIEGCLEEACTVYNQMIHLGGYQPQLSLHNSLFRALVSKPGSSSKHYIKQAEFIFHNLVTSGLEVQRDIYAGLIWLHSFQDSIDKERIASLREAMLEAGFEERTDVLVSVLRACSKDGSVEEAERTWVNLNTDGGGVPPQAFVYKMGVHAKVGEPMKSLEVFDEMQKSGSMTDAGYHKIIEILCEAQEMELAESIMQKFVRTGNKSLFRSFIDIMNMYLNMGLYDKVELAFSQCLSKCRPDRTIYNIYLDSLAQIGNVEKIEEIFKEMRSNGVIGVNAQSCNIILNGFLSSGDNVKAEEMYDFMCQKKYDIEEPLMEKLAPILSLRRKKVRRSESPNLSKEQREILVGLLLGGMPIESDERRRNHVIRFEFKENFDAHSVLRTHIYDQFHEWIHSSSKPVDGSDAIPYIFYTIPHKYFGFYADQFRPNDRPVIPNLIHRWLSPCTLAYWYMYGGQRTPSGDIALRLKGDHEGVERVVIALRTYSLDCKVKRKGRIYWIGFLDSNATCFWKLIEPFVLNDMKDDSKEGDQGQASDNGMIEEAENMNSDDESESAQASSDYSKDDDL